MTEPLFVIGATLQDIHRWATAKGVPWHRVEPVTGANQLRTRPGQRTLTYVWAAVDKMPKAVLSVIRTQLSIRRCLGPVFDATGLYVRTPPMSLQSILGVANYYRTIGQQPDWKPA